MPKIIRRQTPSVEIGRVSLGSAHPVVIQSMTDTPTRDVKSTLAQTCALVSCGSELVRWTINDDEAALGAVAALGCLRSSGIHVPVIGDFHFNGHLLLEKHPALAEGLDKYRINPGNIGGGDRHEDHFARIIRLAVRHGKAVRIGVNGGSLDPEVIAAKMDEYSCRGSSYDSRQIMLDAVVESALSSCSLAQQLGLSKDRIVLSAKLSLVQDTIEVYERIARLCDHVLHIGLTEAGAGVAGIAASSAALSVLLQQGIGDTIRVSLTPQPGEARTREVEVAREILQSMGFRFFTPVVTSCPGCGRTSSVFFQELARDIREHISSRMPVWQKEHPGVEKLRIAVMGCVVNGPGESRHADIGISLPGASEDPSAPVYIDGKKYVILRGDDIKGQFISVLEEYIRQRF